MDEGRKRVIVIAAAIIASRRLNEIGFKPCPVYDAAIANAVRAAEKIMSKVESNWPTPNHNGDF